MRVEFKKIGSSKREFFYEIDNIKLSGDIYKKDANLVVVTAKIEGLVELLCDMCLNPISKEIKEDIVLYVSDGLYTQNEDEFLEVVEFFDGFLDFDELAKSELELIKSDYHICSSCNK